MKDSDIRVHGIQYNFIVGDIEGNTTRIIDYIASIADMPKRVVWTDRVTHLIVTSELAVCGYAPQDLLLNDDFVRRCEDAVEKIAQRVPENVYVLVGHPAFTPNQGQIGSKKLINAASLLNNGAVKRVFAKTLLPTYNIFNEARYFEPCKDPGKNVFYISGVPIGVTICEDIWNEGFQDYDEIYGVRPVEELRQKGAQFIVNLSASPYCFDKEKSRSDMIRGICDTYGIDMFYVNQVGANDSLVFDGRSTLYLGGRAHVLPAFEEAAEQMGVTVSMNRKLDYHIREREDSTIGDSVFNMRKTLVTGVRDYFEKLGLKTAIIGMSGGIDSALTAAIAAEAIGPENVVGVTMPTKFSSDSTKGDAHAQACNMGIRFCEIPLQEMYALSRTSCWTGLRDIGAVEDSDAVKFNSGVTDENFQPRLRGLLLMGISNDLPGAIVLATGNKSELAMGYATLYGDMCGGLGVLGDAYKTQVFELSEYYADDTEDGPKWIPRSVITRPPSAELAEGQEDTDSLPPYPLLDAALKIIIDQDGNATESDFKEIGNIYAREFEAIVAPLRNRADASACDAFGAHIPMPTDFEALIALSEKTVGIDRHAMLSRPESIGKAIVGFLQRKVYRNEFKRQQAAPCICLNPRPWNVGWKRPIVVKS